MSAVDEVIRARQLKDSMRVIGHAVVESERQRAIAIVEDELKYEYHPIVRRIVERIRGGEC